MLHIGLTGGIGSGKSTVAGMFQTLGIPVCDTDQVARDVVAPGEPALQEIAAAFGQEVISSNGELDRPQLRSIVFSDPAKRQRLEGILHPRIAAAVDRWLAAQSAPYCVVVVPLLFEAGWETRFDRVLVVDVLPELQLARTISRDAIPEREAAAIIASQAARDTRLERADDVVTNDGDLDSLRRQIEHLHRCYLALTCQQG